MNADLALWLIERGVPVGEAKAIAETAVSQSDIALGLVDSLGLPVAEAKAMAAEAPLVVDMATGKAQPSRPDPVPRAMAQTGALDDVEAVKPMRVPVVGADGLTDRQRAAIEKGVALCPNCQQPVNSHLPGCARASGEDPKARTKTALPPVQ